MKSPLWWVRHDRIGRSRLVILALGVLSVLSSVVADWPDRSDALVASMFTVVLFVGDYLFWRADLRRAARSDDGRPPASDG
ncbi:hypothetical protein GCM10010492_38070 [Saccharothrix mutabilis subsp. mutabilis]|uniref:Uncharacterized protein n=1 Tax=Saccharothrix mutabilis subsp. mutabilis TaxID=66855 RepID=A0ABN0U1H3_9PSEU